MPFTTVGFLQDVDQVAVYVALTALADQHVRVVGNDIQIPGFASMVIAIAGGVDSTAAHRARLTTPGLRRRALFQVTPLNGQAAAAQEPDSPHAVVDLRFNPLKLAPQEQLNFEAFANPAAVQDQWGIVWFGDGPVVVMRGEIFTIRATSATAAVANVWTNVALTFDEDLPRGLYQIVGMRPESGGMVAARFVIVGSGFRPGALGVDAQQDIQHEMFRYGNLGSWGEFEDLDPPTIDVLSIAADATQEFYIDLIQMREGPG